MVAEQPGREFNEVARQLIARNVLERLRTAAWVLALENLAAADAAIQHLEQYHFDFWWPFQAIGKAALDDNPATAPGPDVDAADLRTVFGEPIGTPRARQLAHNRVADVLRQRTRGRLPDHEQLREPRRTGDARVHQLLANGRRDRRGTHLGGLHFRTADVQAVQLGTNVANYAAANYFEPVGNH